MSEMTIQAEMLRKMFLAGTRNLALHKEEINELNVFPVPDGDTGTNMTMTAESAADEVERLYQADIKEIAKAISGGSLRGARGNSGVILSQLFRGFTNEIKAVQEIDAETCAHAMQRAVETAYKAVMKPKEGTILTVARAMADRAEEHFAEAEDMADFFANILAAGEEALANTPELLPVLKEAGVVDSGGKGLMTFLSGAVDAFNGLELDEDIVRPHVSPVVERETIAVDEEEIRFGYCTEFIIMLDREFTDADEEEMKSYLTSIGDSLVLVADEDIVKIHVHTNDPGLAIQRALTYGQLTRMKIDNMREEHKERLFRASEYEAARKADQKRAEMENKPRAKCAMISVCAGSGLAEMFREIGVAYVIEGGQTMNPSTEDILKAIEKVHAEEVYVMPNNGNILLAANQAASLCKDCHVHVIPSKTIPQGIAACVEFLPDADVEENLETMQAAISDIQSGEVTYAIRNTTIDGREVKKGDYIGISDQGLCASGKDFTKTVLSMIEEMKTEDAELISVYTGADLSDRAAKKLEKAIGNAFPDLELVFENGGQPVYYCILSVE